VSTPLDADGGTGSPRAASERIPTDPRLSRRRRAGRRSRRRRALARAAVAAALALAMWVAFWSPLLAVRAVTVVGGRHTTTAEVAGVTRVVGDNLLLLSTAEMAERVASLPWVRRARVERILPATVRVRVRERRAALVARVASRPWTIDAFGRVLAAGRPSTPLPALVGAVRGPVAPGAVLSGDAASAALRAFRSLGAALRQRVVALFAPTVERITLSLRGGTLVRLGAAERLRAKRSVLEALLRRLDRDGRAAAYVDVRAPESPAVGGARGSP
jgi:cell division protein FtsQ